MMRQKRPLLTVIYEWASIVAVMIFAIFFFFAIVGKAVKKARAIEAVSNIGTLGVSLERCYLLQNTYGACQGGFFWKGHWNLDVQDPDLDPNAHFEYGVWADNRDWVIAARPKNIRKGDPDYKTFVTMSSYSDGKVIFCGFDADSRLCDELRVIIPRR